MRLAVPRRRGAALVLGRDPLRVIQHRQHLAPDGRLELVAAHRTVVAKGLAAELMRVSADTAIVAVVGRLVPADRAARHFAVERVAAAPADHEALQQPAGPAPAVALAPPVLLELRTGRLEQLRIDDGGYRDRDPLRRGHPHL